VEVLTEASLCMRFCEWCEENCLEACGGDLSGISVTAEVTYPVEVCEWIIPKGSGIQRNRDREADHYHQDMGKQGGAIRQFLARNAALFYVGLPQEYTDDQFSGLG